MGRICFFKERKGRKNEKINLQIYFVTSDSYAYFVGVAYIRYG